MSTCPLVTVSPTSTRTAVTSPLACDLMGTIALGLTSQVPSSAKRDRRADKGRLEAVTSGANAEVSAGGIVCAPTAALFAPATRTFAPAVGDVGVSGAQPDTKADKATSPKAHKLREHWRCMDATVPASRRTNRGTCMNQWQSAKEFGQQALHRLKRFAL